MASVLLPLAAGFEEVEAVGRSEERRVGKECSEPSRSRWGACLVKKKQTRTISKLKHHTNKLQPTN